VRVTALGNPATVWSEVDDAARMWETLCADGLELHFEPDREKGGASISLRDLDGNVVRGVSAQEAVSIASGLAG